VPVQHHGLVHRWDGEEIEAFHGLDDRLVPEASTPFMRTPRRPGFPASLLALLGCKQGHIVEIRQHADWLCAWDGYALMAFYELHRLSHISIEAIIVTS
jgi:hypothetical protein